MSITDKNETKEPSTSSSKRCANKSPPRKIRHRNTHSNEDDVHSSDGMKGSAKDDFSQNMMEVALTTEEVVEYSRFTVEEMLNRELMETNYEENHYHGDEQLCIIPSLVSLSTDFFNTIDSEIVDEMHSSFPSLNEASSSLQSYSLRPRQSEPNSGGTNTIDNANMNASEQQQQFKRPATPPIGPQGAPIPRHIVESRATRQAVDSPVAASASARSTNNNNNLGDNANNAFQPPSSPNPRQIFTASPHQNALLQLSAPPRLNSQYSVTSRQSHVNVVSSLVEAVDRMERRIEAGERASNNNSYNSRGDNRDGVNKSRPISTEPPQGQSKVPLPSNNQKYKDNIDELEAPTITKLAEIMLHPPSSKVVRISDDKSMGDDDGNYGKGDEMEQEEEEIVKYLWTNEDNVYDEEKGDEKQVNINSRQITISKSRYTSSSSAHASVAKLGQSIPRRVCQHPFRRNDIVWVCRTCQSDETCVLCHDCFTHSHHEGHDVAFYHAQAGGCCDCGDADAWDPAGFCSKHGQTLKAPSGSAVSTVEPSVLGGVVACAHWLVDVVRDVEGGYQRANPALFEKKKEMSVGEEDRRLLLERSISSSANCDRRSGMDTRQRSEMRRQHSLERRNTVADVETMDIDNEDEDDDNEDGMMGSAAVLEEMVHEVQFNPAAASTSKKWADLKPSSDAGASSDSERFDPEAAGSRATKKAKSPPEQSPARALGDLGREEQGLFLVLHADDIHTGAHQPTEVIEALKALYSSPGGSQRRDNTTSSSTAAAAATSSAGDAFSFGTTFNPRPIPRLAPRLGRDGTNPYLFRAPQADAIINKIIRLVQKHGNVIVWGTQEIIAECGDVIAGCWLHGDPDSSTMIGAAMLNRAKMLTDRGLVCSIKTHKNLRNDQKATAVIRFIASIAESCDPLCDQVSSGLSGRGISPTLNAIIRSDLKLPCKWTNSWHALLLNLLAQPEFKAALAVAYCDTYRAVAKEYSRGVGVVERSSFTLSVQFLNRVTYVENLVRDRNLLSKLSKSLLETMSSASFVPGSPGSPTPSGANPDTLTQLSSLHTEPANMAAVLMALFGSFTFGGDENVVLLELDSELDNMMNDRGGNITGGDSRHHGRISRAANNNMEQLPPTQVTVESLMKRTQALVPPTLNPSHPFLQHRRYSPCISDLKCVLNVKGMSRIFLSLPDASGSHTNNDGIAIDNWIKTLSLAQNMDGQMWRSWNLGHVESEHRGWVGAFNTSISLGSVFERLLNWEDSDPCILEGHGSMRLLSCAEVAHYTLTTGVHRWQRSEMLSYRSTPHPSCTVNAPPHVLCPAALPFSTVASCHGTNLAMVALPLSQIQVWSFHLPLHRFTAACIREVCRRPEEGGINDLLHMFDVQDYGSKSECSKLRQNALLFRGLMEFPVIVLSRSAQIRAGIWRRNGPGMTDQVLNYSEPPFCKALQDSDILLVQFALICHALYQDCPTDISGLSFQGGSSRLINLLLHRFGVFDFLGFETAPSTDVNQYYQEVKRGYYPAEIVAQTQVSHSNALPWTYTPARDFAMSIALVEELLMLIIIIITEMPSPPARNADESAREARRRLWREVIHRLASGPKTHSEMSEVHHVLSQRDNLVLCDEGKHINPDDASGAALESVLDEVALRKTRIGDADQWELRKSAWESYDPAFHRIGTRAHQSATEQRPKHPPDHCSPYAPKPPNAHESFNRIRKDLTSDVVILSIVYRVIHAYCYENSSLKSKATLRGKEMYEGGTKSEASLARAVHILTLGAFVWEENTSIGGTDIGSVFHDCSSPSAKDWVDMALLRNPEKVMNSAWYQDQENALLLLKRVASESMVNDMALRSGAAWLLDFAANCNPTAASLLGRGISTVGSPAGGATDSQDDELTKRKALAKARQQQAMEKMKAQMAKFAQTVGQLDDSDEDMSIQDESSQCQGSESFEQPTFTTPIRNRSGSGANSTIHALDLGSPGEFVLTTPPPSYPSTPRTPCSSGSVTPKSMSYHSVHRLLNKRPFCIICGTDNSSSIKTDKGGDTTPLENKSLAFVAYAQPSLVSKGGGGGLPLTNNSPECDMRRHVGVFVNLCGHAVHSSCCESYLKTVHRDDRYIDRLEGGKRKEFRCPLCQRLSNCLVPFIDVGVDWIESPQRETDDAMEEIRPNDTSIQKFLSSSTWWRSRNDPYVTWDGHCAFVTNKNEDKKLAFPHLATHGVSLKKHVFGKKDLISAWNRVLKTPRLVQRSARGLTLQKASDSGVSFHNLEPEKQSQSAADVWRRFMDTVSDIALKADTKRLGEETVIKDYGEFRHYHFEKAIYNKMNIAAGKEPTEWPACISSATLSESRRQELSKEKLLSKLLFMIQSFTYSCCSEAAEVRREFLNAQKKGTPSEPTDLPAILSQFGLEKILLEGNLLLFPRAMSSVDGGFQPFDGRLGKLRYLALSLMVATSPISSEIVQLCMSFPFSPESSKDPFDFDQHLKESEKKRAPVVYPVLRGHVLTHTVCCLIAVTGQAQADEENRNVNSIADDCREFITLGLLARTAQYLLSSLLPRSNISDWKIKLGHDLQLMMSQKATNEDKYDNEWFTSCLTLLQALISCEPGSPGQAKCQELDSTSAPSSTDLVQSITKAVQLARVQAIEFLRDISNIQQILIPNIFAEYQHREPCATQDEPVAILNYFMQLFGLESLQEVIRSRLVKEILRSWFREATESQATHLDSHGKFSGITWPQSPKAYYHHENDKSNSTLVPLLGRCDFAMQKYESLCRITGLPISYTDLYADLVLLCPDCEQIALCLVCGEVLNASGKGECSRHAFKCGGGVGVFFLLQECVSLMVHGVKAAYIHSPYVDSHGETPQYRGRPLNLDASRYEILTRLWCGHRMREKVIAERGTSRQVIIPNFY